MDHLAERGLISASRVYIPWWKAAPGALEVNGMPGKPLSFSVASCKIRNILAYLPETQQHWFKYKLRLAYAQTDGSDARQALYRLQAELNELNPSAAARLMEGLEETLTLHDLQVHARLR